MDAPVGGAQTLSHAADGGDPDALAQALRRNGVPPDLDAVLAIISGVAAAPPDVDADAWMELVAADLDADARRLLRTALDEARRRLEQPADGTAADHLDAVRALLRRRRLNGFVVPRADEHQGEQVAARDERLAWISGFTGSAGTAIVTAEHAALFVDGRYIAQAEAQIDGGRWAVLHMLDAPITDWIAQHLQENGRLGYDPWLHTPSQVADLRAACRRVRARLVAVDDNPVDALWRDRPPPPLAPVVPFDPAFAGRSAAEKREEAAAALRAHNQDAAFLSAPDSIAWLLNIRGGDVPFAPLPLCFACLRADAAVTLFIDPRKLTPAVRAHFGDDVTVVPVAALAAALDTLAAGKPVVRIQSDATPDWVCRRLERAGAVVVAGPDPCALPKAVKNPVELAGIRAAHRRDGAALVCFLAWLAAAAPGGGVTELAAAAMLETIRRRNERFRGLSFPTISAAGGHGAIVHYRPTLESDRRLEPGSLFLIDSGAQYLDGTTDVTRTVAVGPPTATMRAIFTRVLKGHIAMATARFPKGTTGPQLDVLARRALWSAGLDYDHGTGHGVGCYLGVHEGPHRISKLPNRIALQPGMIVSNEPGYYRRDAFGIRIENLVAVTAVDTPAGGELPMLGFETLTLAPIDRNLVDRRLLNAGERAWLDSYHARVRAELQPLVDAETATWLHTATRPLSG